MRIVRALTNPLIIWALATALLASLRLFGAQVSLTWDSSTESDIAGYKIWYTSSSTKSSIDVGKVTSATVPNLSDGTTYTFYATAYNAAGLESAPSSSIVYTTSGSAIVTPPPDPSPTIPTLISQPASQNLGVGNPLQLSV